MGKVVGTSLGEEQRLNRTSRAELHENICGFSSNIILQPAFHIEMSLAARDSALGCSHEETEVDAYPDAMSSDAKLLQLDMTSQGLTSHVHMFSDFPEMLMARLNEQRQHSLMCDVTIITKDGCSFRAHKAVLAAISRYLEAELSALGDEKLDRKSEAVIHLGMISSVSFGTLLDLVYTSKLVLSRKNVAEVLLAADILDLDQVGTICRKFLRSQVKSKSVACGTLRNDSPPDYMSPRADLNNNALSPPHHKKFRRSPDNYQRGVSEESATSSSSGVSSCSSVANAIRETNLEQSALPADYLSSEEADVDIFDHKPDENAIQRHASLPYLSSGGKTDRKAKLDERPVSAPAELKKRPSFPRNLSLCVSDGESSGLPEKRRKNSDVREESQDMCANQGKMSCSSYLSGVNLSDKIDKFNHEVTIHKSSHLTKMERNEEENDVFGQGKQISFPPYKRLSTGTACKVKSEVQIMQNFYQKDKKYPTAGVDDEATPDSEGATCLDSEQNNSLNAHIGLERISHRHQNASLPVDDQSIRSKSIDIGGDRLNSKTNHFGSSDTVHGANSVGIGQPFVPSVGKISFDSAASAFRDLNSTHSSARRKGRSEDKQRPIEKAPYGQTNSTGFMPQGPFGDTSSFLASLYMLRSQALNPASLLSPSYNLQNTPHGAPLHGVVDQLQRSPGSPALDQSAFSRKHLQHSNSIVSSSALLCKLCRLEFTSEWSLSMHHRLYHPLSYFYQPQPSTPNDGQPAISGPTDEAHQLKRDLPSSLPLPLIRTTSSPCRLDRAQRDKEAEKSFTFTDASDSVAVHKCYHCKKEFSSIFLLRKHKSTEHMKRPFKCHRCDSAFPNKAGLSVHLRSHTGERPYRCKVCNKAFTQLGHVQRHQKVHTGEKPYQCPLCQARVRDKASMHYHILAHQGVKPFKCDQCDARFTKRSSLVKHKNVHTGAFLYQCPQCKASFREKASLSRHVRSQHKDPCFTVSSDYVSGVALEAGLSINTPVKKNVSPVDLTMDNHVDVVKVA